MMNFEIKQLIPAPDGLMAHYRNVAGEEYMEPVVVLAWIREWNSTITWEEAGPGDRREEIMGLSANDLTNGWEVWNTLNSGGFLGFKYKEVVELGRRNNGEAGSGQ